MTERFSPKGRNACPVDMQVKEPRRGWDGRKGGWAIAQSPIMITTITLDRMAKRGYESLLDYYLNVRPEQTFMGISFTSCLPRFNRGTAVYVVRTTVV